MRGEAARDSGRRQRVRIVASILSASELLVACAKAFELRVNWTESMPRGLYQRVDPALVRGESVAVCLDGEAARIAHERLYVIAGSCTSGLADQRQLLLPANDN